MDLTKAERIELRNQKIMENIKLVYFHLNKYRGFPNYEDIIQVGMMALVEAIDRSKDLEHLNRNYIGLYIQGYVRRYLNYDAETIRLPHNREDLDKYRYVSMDKVIDETGDTYGDLMLEDKYDCIGELITMIDFGHMVDQLSPRTQKPMRCMLQGYGMADAAKLCGISVERVRQIKNKCNRELVASEV